MNEYTVVTVSVSSILTLQLKYKYKIMEKIKENSVILLTNEVLEKQYKEKRKLEFGNYQFCECSDIKTKMVWSIVK